MHDGLLERAGDQWRLRFTRHLAHPPEKVWRALTEAEHLERWFPTTIEGERAAGASLRFSHQNAELPPFEGEMLTYEPPSLIEFRWGPDTLRFELRAAGDGTELTLVDTLEEVGKAARDGAGWHTCLDLLACHLDDDEPPWSSTERWSQVHPSYVKEFGPEAAAIGPPGE